MSVLRKNKPEEQPNPQPQKGTEQTGIEQTGIEQIGIEQTEQKENIIEMIKKNSEVQTVTNERRAGRPRGVPNRKKDIMQEDLYKTLLSQYMALQEKLEKKTKPKEKKEKTEGQILRDKQNGERLKLYHANKKNMLPKEKTPEKKTPEKNTTMTINKIYETELHPKELKIDRTSPIKQPEKEPPKRSMSREQIMKMMTTTKKKKK
jgi:hypothetical protein